MEAAKTGSTPGAESGAPVGGGRAAAGIAEPSGGGSAAAAVTLSPCGKAACDGAFFVGRA